MKNNETPSEDYFEQQFEDFYMNAVQIRASLIDPNSLFCEIGRAGGKTDAIMAPRIIRVADSMPRELAFLVHKTYVALMTNVWPNIAAAFSRPVHNGTRPMLQYGIDYIVGESKIPKHFKLPRYPISYPKHSILFRNGFHLQMVASDQPESVAGRSGVHAFIEEMKHSKGKKLKSRLFPSLRGSSAEIRQSEYYQGITGVSDTARVDLDEDNWFEEYEHLVDEELIDEIATAASHLNSATVEKFRCNMAMRREQNPVKAERLRLEMEKSQRQINLWRPRVSEMRRNATYYIRASTFVNKDILGPKYFKTQLDSLDMDEFLTSVCAIRRKEVVNKFFAAYKPALHNFSDSYKYESILKFDLKDKFILTSHYLKHYDPDDELILGYDPGHFSSLIALQEKPYQDELRVIKEFYCCYPEEQPELGKQFYEFFGSDARDKRIKLYFDRAANKTREEFESIATDARSMKRELESYGFQVELMNEGQSTIYHWQQFNLLLLAFSNKSHAIPRILIDENECKNLVSSILLSPLKNTGGKIELDKTSEKKVALHRQAGLTTQLATALIYALYGLYADKIPENLLNIPADIPNNMLV